MSVIQAPVKDRLCDVTFDLDRRDAFPQLVGDHRDFLIVSGLAGASKDVAALTDDGPNAFTMAGAMGASVAMGLGLALAQPSRRVLVVTGEGELLMNVGTLATAAVMAPTNLGIVCIDNGHYGETGYQRTHTSFGADLALMAKGAGIDRSVTVSETEEITAAGQLLRTDGLTFVLLRCAATEPASCSRNLHADQCRVAFRDHVTAISSGE